MRRTGRVLLLGLVLSCRRPPRAPVPATAATAVVVPTEDDASVLLHRHAASGPPVLLVHGLGSRSRYWDLTPQRSLAGFLQQQGHDVWRLDLRGHGGHQKTADGKHLKTGWTLDDYGRFDLAAAVAHIQRATGHQRVALVGHSLGGMLLAVYQAWHGDNALSSAVVLGSPLEFHHPDRLLRLARSSLVTGQALPAFPTPAVGWLFQGGKLPFRAQELLYNPDNLDPATQRAVFVGGAGPVSRGEMKHLVRVLGSGEFVSMDGTQRYLERLETLSVPLLVVAGRSDVVAPPDRVRPFFDAAGSTDKRWVLAGRDHGFAADYGHLDLTLGIHAPDEIFPLVEAWVSQHRPDAQKTPATESPAPSGETVGP